MSKNLTFKEALGPLILLWLGHFLIDFMIGIWPVYKTLAKLDLTLVGLITAAAVALGEGMQLFFGPFGDLGHRRKLLLVAIAASLAPCLYSFTESYLCLGILLYLTCIASAAFHPTAASLIGKLTVSQKGLFVTFFASGGALGLATSQIFYSFFYKLMNGNTLPLTLFPLILFVILLKFLKEESVPKQKGIKFIAFSDLKFFFKDSRLALLYLLQVSNQTVVWALVFLLPDLLTERSYPEWLCFGGGHLFMTLGGALMMIPSGYLADKKSPRLVVLLATSIGASLFFTLIYLPSMPLLALILLLILTGASLNLVNPVSISFGYRIMPERPGLVGAGLMGLVWIIAEGVGQGGSGLLAGLFADGAAAKALAVIGFLFIPAIAASYLLPKENNEALGEVLPSATALKL